jgi:outer membrane immunogenic protein
MTIKYILAAAALASAVSTASAADMTRPVYKAVTPAVAAYNWTGLYVGLNVGYYSVSGSFTQPGFPVSSDTGDGGFAGGQIGVNWQAPGSPWVFGLEGDLGATFSDRRDPPSATVNTLRAHIETIGTARARVGYAVDRALWYVTGGLAWADNEVTLRGPAIGGSISTSKAHTGWTIGGGLEWAFADAWSAKIEYLYMSLGNEHYFPNIVGAPGFGIEFDIQTVKAGLNYNFGAGKGPVVAKY